MSEIISFLRLLPSILSLLIRLFMNNEHSNTVDSLPPHEDLQIVYKNINCSAIYEHDPVELQKAHLIRRNNTDVEEMDEHLTELTTSCSTFLKIRGYDDVCVTEEETDFPLAFSLVVHKSAVTVERLIKAIYSPANVYCIHYPEMSPPQFISAMRGLAECLPNVFITSKREDSYHSSRARLKADLNCLSDLLKSETKWKYVINLREQDFPLRSNIELVSELKELHGGNMLETYHLSEDSVEFKEEGTDKPKTPPPHGIELFTGSAFFTLSRDFIVYVNSSTVVWDFLDWLKDTHAPEDHFWATLVRLPGVPGEVPRSQPGITYLMSKTRLMKSVYHEFNLYPPCSGKHSRGMCVFGAEELRWLLGYGHWFANKFDPKVDPVVLQCLEEELKGRQKIYGC